MQADCKQRWDELTRLIEKLDRGGPASLGVGELKRVCRLYRQVTIDLSRARTDNENPDLIRYLNQLAARAHGHVYTTRRVNVRPFFAFLARGFPQIVRRQAQPLLAAVLLFYGTSLASFLAVVNHPELAYSLFDEQVVEFENIRLERQEGEYRGNFTFDVSKSPLMAVLITANNIKVAILAFSLGALLCIPGAVLLVFNGRMLGTLSGVVWLHGYLRDFYSLILTHGVLELTAICIAGGAGFVLGWALIAPGPWTRQEALRRAAPDAFGLLGGVVVLLLIAGHIEAYVTPHFSQPVRWTVAMTSGLLLFAHLVWGNMRVNQEAHDQRGKEVLGIS